MRRTRIIKCVVLKKIKTPYTASGKTNAPYRLDQQNTMTAVNAEIKEKTHKTNKHTQKQKICKIYNECKQTNKGLVKIKSKKNLKNQKVIKPN